jgi:hypothetical protein
MVNYWREETEGRWHGLKVLGDVRLLSGRCDDW